jgi:hypothetical protein
MLANSYFKHTSVYDTFFTTTSFSTVGPPAVIAVEIGVVPGDASYKKRRRLV